MKLVTNKSPEDIQYADFKRIFNIFGKVDKLIGDTEWVESTLADLTLYQPVLRDVLMSYDRKVPPDQLAEVFLLYLSIWTYFKDEPAVKTNAITQEKYNRVYLRNMERFEKNDASDMETISVLFAAILERNGKEEDLMAMDIKVKAELIVGIKSMIKCFEGI